VGSWAVGAAVMEAAEGHVTTNVEMLVTRQGVLCADPGDRMVGQIGLLW
jgi:hypothetical protein